MALWLAGEERESGTIKLRVAGMSLQDGEEETRVRETTRVGKGAGAQASSVGGGDCLMVALEADPQNPKDKHAIKVMVGSVQVGWVPSTQTHMVVAGPAKLIATRSSIEWEIEANLKLTQLSMPDPITSTRTNTNTNANANTDEDETKASDGFHLNAAFVEVKGPGDSFEGRQGQLVWLKAMREAGVDSRLCIVADEPLPKAKPQKQTKRGKSKGNGKEKGEAKG
eukprot:FR738360.1.p1 GENE.FR738360.1~~FR738360.1.p1  ORF type:complete len:243 (+),score=36.43 FR738360.1:55-729(+)